MNTRFPVLWKNHRKVKIKSKLTEEEDLKLMRLAQESTKGLLNLVNQVMDLSKLEARRLTLKASESDIVVFLKGIFYSFESLAQKNDISLSFESESASQLLHFDAEKMEVIFTNLLSNAFKYCSRNDNISLALFTKDKSLIVKLTDTGKGISKETIEHIFDRYFQVENENSIYKKGTGIGLSLVKEMVALHDGMVKVSSEVGLKTCFELSFPLGSEHLNESEIVVHKEHLTEVLDRPVFTSKDSENREHSILVIEDHPDVRNFIKSQLVSTFTVYEAENGNAGIKMAKEKMPDLIISDVMMPGKNGYQVCTELKTNIETSHIPVILLTARSGSEDKLEGLESGADDFLLKPFDSNELEVRVKNLIKLRKQLRARFSKAVQIKPTEVSVNSMDQVFMEKAMLSIENHMSNEDFNVDILAKEIGMSQTNLNRKLRSLIDQSTSQFIKSIRLQRAADLLKANSGSVSEIAFQTGFKSAAYFTSTFKKQFGISPGAYKSS